MEEKEVYVIFHTDIKHLDHYIGAYNPSIVDVIFSSYESNLINRFINYIYPPFNSVAIGIKNLNHPYFDIYGFDMKRNFYHDTSTLLRQEGYSILCVTINQIQYRILDTIIKYFVLYKESKLFCYYKMSLIGGKCRNLFWMNPKGYPYIQDSDWFCSEFVAFCLQQSGILDSNSFHPSYCAPVHIFYDLLFSEQLIKGMATNPYFSTDVKRVVGNSLDTNAIVVFNNIMKIGNIDRIRLHAKKQMSQSLCVKFKCPPSSITVNSIKHLSSNTPEKVLYSWEKENKSVDDEIADIEKQFVMVDANGMKNKLTFVPIQDTYMEEKKLMKYTSRARHEPTKIASFAI